ncbi:MAG: hypothetical protein AAF721_17435 [Myxococcota bacterium]
MRSVSSVPRAPTWQACLLAVSSLFVACDGPETGTEPEAKPAAAAGGAAPDAKAQPAAAKCDAAHAKKLENEMLRMCRAEKVLTRVDVPPAPWDVASTPLPSSARVEVVPTRMSVSGLVCDSPKKVLDALALEREISGKLGQTPEPWTLEIGQSTPTSDVAALFKALADANYATGRIVVTVPATGMPKPRRAEQLAKLHEQAAGKEASDRSVVLARAMEPVLSACPDLEETTKALGNVDPAMKCTLMARGVSEGLVSCHCQKEDELLTFIYAAFVDTAIPERSAAMLDVTIDPTAAPRPGSTWGEVVKGLDQASAAKLWVGG